MLKKYRYVVNNPEHAIANDKGLTSKIGINAL
jgi:hypothetical protein